MHSVVRALSRFRHEEAAVHPNAENPFRLESVLSGPATRDEIAAAWGGSDVPVELMEMWSICRQARLFEDIDYGQWGLVLLEPVASAERSARERAIRPLDFKEDHVVVGEFLGDQELLVLAPSETGRRRVIVALPLDPRADWLAAAPSMGEFFDAYFVSGGKKFWEPSQVKG